MRMPIILAAVLAVLWPWSANAVSRTISTTVVGAGSVVEVPLGPRFAPFILYLSLQADFNRTYCALELEVEGHELTVIGLPVETSLIQEVGEFYQIAGGFSTSGFVFVPTGPLFTFQPSLVNPAIRFTDVLMRNEGQRCRVMFTIERKHTPWALVRRPQ